MNKRTYVIVSIDLSNAAFSDAPEAEVARILRALAKSIAAQPYLSDGFSIPACDTNGNEVGFLSVKAVAPGAILLWSAPSHGQPLRKSLDEG